MGGADKVPTFVALLGAQKKMKVATLIDIQHKDRQRIENLYKVKLLQKKNVLTFADFTNTPEADIEDMFELDFYLKLVNAEYAKGLQEPLEVKDLGLKGHRVLRAIEQYLKGHPLKNGETFNHYRPARYFLENAAALIAHLSEATLSRFEAASKTLNALL